MPVVHVTTPATQLAVTSLQVSAPLHATPSSQKPVAAPAQRPPEHASLTVQNIPSSQTAPSFALKEVVERTTSQT
jgi:hypothetical protein